MEKKIRVLHVFECFDQGGIENFVMNIYRNMDRSKVEFDFAFINRTEGVFDDEARALGGNIYYFQTEKKTISNYYVSLKKIIKEHGPYDVIHSHMYYFSGVILLFAKWFGVPKRIAHSHETSKGRKNTMARRLYERIMRSLIRRNANCLLSCTDIAGDFVFGESADCTTLYNGIDMTRFRFNPNARESIRKQLKIENKKVLICIGRFADQKNHFYLIDCFEQIHKWEKDVALILIGTGSLMDDVKQVVKEKQLEDSVIFLSNIMNTEDYYSASDIFLLPAKYEGMSIVSVEAQAMGLPCLLSDRVPSEIDATDLVVHLPIGREDVEKWVDSSIELLQKPIDRVSYNEIFKNSKFDIINTVNQLSDIYGG